jgi:hypothetical protein
MAVSLLTVVQRVSRDVGLDATVTAFSETDDTNFILQLVNEAYEELMILLPPDTDFRQTSGTITTANTTRLYALPSNAMPFDLYEWSFVDTTNSYARLHFATKDFIQALDTKYKTTSSKPQYVYTEGAQNVGFYPVPDGTYSIAYEYGQSLTTRLSNTTDVFLVPDRWVRYIEKSAQEKYERLRGYGDPDNTELIAFNLLGEVLVEAWETNNTYMINEGLC